MSLPFLLGLSTLLDRFSMASTHHPDPKAHSGQLDVSNTGSGNVMGWVMIGRSDWAERKYGPSRVTLLRDER